MKKGLIIGLLMLGALVAGSAGKRSMQEYQTICGSWGALYPVLETCPNGNQCYVWYQDRTCIDQIVDYSTFPPTQWTSQPYTQRRGGQYPNVD